jgi:hypothetical protein
VEKLLGKRWVGKINMDLDWTNMKIQTVHDFKEQAVTIRGELNRLQIISIALY